MSGQTTVRAARASAVIGVILAAVGMWGVHRGIVELASGPATAQPESTAATPLEEAEEASSRAVLEVLDGAPLRRPLSAANAVVSALLLVGGFMLFTRRGSAPWLVAQAAVANAVWTGAEITSQITALLASAGQLTNLFDAEITALAHAEASGDLPVDGSHKLGMLVAMVAGVGLARVVLYGWIGLRVRRADIRELIEAAHRARGTGN